MISKSWSVIAIVLLFAASCKSPTSGPGKETAPAQTVVAEPAKSAGPNQYKAYADAALAIGYLLQADTMVWADIKAKYDIARIRINAMDLKHKKIYAAELLQALNNIEAGESVEVNRHVVTKGLQHVTVLTISGLLDDLITSDLKNAGEIRADIRTVFAAIQPTFKRRDDTVYGGTPTLVPAAEQAMTQLEAAKTKPALASAAMNFTTLLSKTYTLSVLFEMKGVEAFCGQKTPDPQKCAVKRTEARIYYRIIEQSVESSDREADIKIEKMINSEQAVPKYTEVRDLLAKTLAFAAEDLTF